MTDAPRTSHDAAIERASAALATDPAGAELQAEALLRAAPNDPRAALILASARRRLGRHREALAILNPLARAFPRAATTQYELGLALGVVGDSGAEAALRQATSLNPGLSDAWRALGDLLFARGDMTGAESAFAEYGRAVVTDPGLRPAADAVFEGRFADAELHLRAYLARVPTNAQGLRMLAEAVARQGRDPEAETLLALCLKVDPDYDGARFAYADVLFRRQKGTEALAQIERLHAADADDPAYRNLLAACLALVGDYARALALYEDLLAQFPAQARIWLNYGQALRTTGRQDETVAAFRRCLAVAPDLGEAYWSLANLKTVSFSTEEIAAMEARLRREDLAVADRLHLHYALGKALEDRADHAASFEHYAAGAAVRRAERPYDAAAETNSLERARALFTPDFFATRHGGSNSHAPIFIVGLPRAGSTLVEQILASHPAVEGTAELPDIGFIAQDILPAPYPESLGAVAPDRRRALGDLYLGRTASHRLLGRAHFIDKMPNNFHHIGLIQLILPNARIVDVRRHPLASGFSAFKQHFAEGQSFSYDLADIGAYYRDYVALMRHVDAVLPGRVHRVIYEDLVEDIEGEVRRLLAYCGLPFDPACLSFHQNARPVRTVSSEQVRRPIFRDALEQWRRYEPWLDPLKKALGPALERWRD